jgi:hypothetical protein
MAGVLRHHGLAGFATPGFLKFGHVLHDAVQRYFQIFFFSLTVKILLDLMY